MKLKKSEIELMLDIIQDYRLLVIDLEEDKDNNELFNKSEDIYNKIYNMLHEGK